MSENEATPRTVAINADPLMIPMGVNNLPFMLELWARETSDLQFVRELTQNAVEAGSTQVIWDFDEAIHEDEGVRKLCVMDNGRGMTHEEMASYGKAWQASTRPGSLIGAPVLACLSQSFTGNVSYMTVPKTVQRVEKPLRALF